MNISFMNFSILANEICKRSGTDVGQIIQQSFIYECIIEGLLKQYTLQESTFKDVQSLPALARALFQVTQDLTDANVDVDALKAAIKEGFIEGVEIQKLYEVVHLYDMFKQKLKTLNISHHSDVYCLAAACVPDSEFLKGFQHILAYGFYDLNGVEQDFFREIFRSHPSILFLPYQKKHPAFSYVKPFFESFVLGLAHDIEEIPSNGHRRFSCVINSKSKDNFVGDRGLQIDDYGLNTQPTTSNSQHAPHNTQPIVDMHIINASGKMDEVWIVAKEILNLVDKGYKMDEIGMVARTLEPYTDAIKKIFQENYIPFITSTQEPLEKYPLVKIIRQILLLKRENYYRPMVVELLGSPYFKIPVFGHKIVTPRPDLWDILSRRLGIRGDIQCWLSRLNQSKVAASTAIDPDCETYLPKEDAKEGEVERHICIPTDQIIFLENILRIVSNDLSSLPEKASWTIMCQKITHLLQRYIHIPSEEKARDGLIMNKIVDLLDTLCTLDCLNEEVTQDQFIDTLIEACRREGLSIGIENGRGVHVLDAMSARGIPFRALFVLGLNEKVFPRALSEEPFLRDHVRRKLSEVLGNYIPEKLRGFDEERLLFHFLLKAAGEQLYLLFERSDEAGKPKVPSHYLMDILHNMKGTSATRNDFPEKSKYEIYVPRGIKDKLYKMKKQEISLLTPKEIGIGMALDRIDSSYFLKIFGIHPDIFGRSLSALDSIESYNTCLTAYDGIVGDMSQWWNEHAHRGFSPTTLETFGICPLKFFMGRVLELESLEEPEKAETIAAVDIGNLYHIILRDFYRHLIEKKYFDTQGKKINPIELLHRIAKKYFTDVEQQIPIPYPIIWEIKKEDILAFLMKFISWDIEHIEQTGFTPAYLEKIIKLSPQNNLSNLSPACSKQEEALKLLFKGKIDRIDLKGEGNTVSFRVIDYKSGKVLNENIVKSAIRGQKLQLPFYIIMAEHFLSEEIKKGRIPQSQMKLDEASFVYVAQDMENKEEGKGIPKETIKGNDWKDYTEQCGETLKEFLEYIRGGIFPISPNEDKKCEWCEFATACRKGHQPLRFRLERDARLKKYREIINLNINKKSNKPMK